METLRGKHVVLTNFSTRDFETFRVDCLKAGASTVRKVLLFPHDVANTIVVLGKCRKRNVTAITVKNAIEYGIQPWSRNRLSLALCVADTSFMDEVLDEIQATDPSALAEANPHVAIPFP